MDLEKYLGSRKFIIWIGATILYGLGQIDIETWKWVTVAYLGGQSIIDSAKAWNVKSE